MAQLAVCQICFWVLIGAGEYNCLWFFGSIFTTVLTFRFSSSFLSSNVSFLWYYFASAALDTRVRHRVLYVYGSSGIFLCVSSDMLLLSVNSNCVVLFCAWSIHLPLVLLFPLWQFCYWNEIPINPFVIFL